MTRDNVIVSFTYILIPPSCAISAVGNNFPIKPNDSASEQERERNLNFPTKAWLLTSLIATTLNWIIKLKNLWMFCISTWTRCRLVGSRKKIICAIECDQTSIDSRKLYRLKKSYRFSSLNAISHCRTWFFGVIRFSFERTVDNRLRVR